MAKHGVALATSVKRVNKLHSAMWANFKAGSMEEGMEDFGGAGTGKCKGLYRITMSGGRLHIDEGPMYEEYKVFRGDFQGRKRLSPYSGPGSHKKKTEGGSEEGGSERRMLGGSRYWILWRLRRHPLPLRRNQHDWAGTPDGTSVVASTSAQETAEDSFDQEYPVGNLVAGAESQTLTQVPRKLKGKNQGSEPVVLPDGALVIEQKPITYFMPRNRMSFDIQQAHVHRWQDMFERTMIEMAQRVTDMTLTTVSDIHAAEKGVVEAKAHSDLGDQMAKSKEAEKLAVKKKAFLEERIASARKANDDLCQKFEDCFLHRMEDWDGSPEQAQEWLTAAMGKEPGE